MSTTGTQLVQDCRAEVIEPNPAFFSDTRMLALVNLAQQEYVRKTRCLQRAAYTSTIAGQQTYPMPPDWLGSELILWQDQTNVLSPLYRRLLPTTMEKMAQESPNFLSTNPNMFGKPNKYFTIGTTMYIYSTPQYSGNNDLWMYYQCRETPLTSLSQNLSVDDSLVPGLRAYILWKMWKQDQEDSLAEEQHKLFMEEVGWGIKWRNQRVNDLKRKIDIESYMPFSIGGNNYSANGSINPLDLS